MEKESLPSRERELKLLAQEDTVDRVVSLPSRERELKQGDHDYRLRLLLVAPFTGA